MAISFVNKSTFASGTAALTVAAVASVAADDLILLFVESANENIATPTGFTQVTNSPVSTGTAAAIGGVRLAVFYRWATGADTTTSVADSGNHTTAIKMAFRGVHTTTPFDATPVSGIKATASTTATFPGITTATANAWIVHASALDLDAASTATTGTPTNANLTGLTERHDQTISGGVGGGLVVITGEKATAGATGNTTATVTSTIQVYLTMALREAPVLIDYEIDAQPGSLGATGQAADVLADRALNAQPGGLVVTGQDATLTVASALQNYELDAQPGALSLGGQPATVARMALLKADAGAAVLVGQAAGTVATRAVSAAPGALVLTGQAATTQAARTLNADSGALALTGQLAATTATRTLAGSPGAMALTGLDALLVLDALDPEIDASPGAVTLTGQTAATLVTRQMSGEAAMLVLAGQAATLQVARSLNAAAGGLVLTGMDAELTVRTSNAVLVAEPGVLALGGAEATLQTDRTLVAEPGVLGLSPWALPAYVEPGYAGGLEAALLRGRIMVAEPGVIGLTGMEADLQAVTAYPDPRFVQAGVMYGPGGAYAGTLVVSDGGSYLRRR